MNHVVNVFIALFVCIAVAAAAQQHYKTIRYVACVEHHQPKACE